MKVAVYFEIAGMRKRRFDHFTTLEEIEKLNNKDKVERIISDLNANGTCVLPAEGSSLAVYYDVIPES